MEGLILVNMFSMARNPVVVGDTARTVVEITAVVPDIIFHLIPGIFFQVEVIIMRRKSTPIETTNFKALFILSFFISLELII